MSILDCKLAIEKESNGKPFLICDVDTWFYLSVDMIKNKKKIKSEAQRLYHLFGTGIDKSEKPITLEELKNTPSNGGIRIIPKTKDKFIKIEHWKTN